MSCALQCLTTCMLETLSPTPKEKLILTFKTIIKGCQPLRKYKIETAAPLSAKTL